MTWKVMTRAVKRQYLGLSQRLMEEETPPPQVRLHSPQVDHRPQPPSTPSGRVPYATHMRL